MLAELICMEFETVSDLKSDKDKSTALADTHMADRVFLSQKFQKPAENAEFDKAGSCKRGTSLFGYCHS